MSDGSFAYRVDEETGELAAYNTSVINDAMVVKSIFYIKATSK